MRHALCCLLLTACFSDIGAPEGVASFSGPEMVRSARMVGSYVTYNAVPLRAWTIILSKVDGCTATDKQLDLEINLAANGTNLPTGAIPMRAAEPFQALPSALLRYNGATLTSGTITLDAVSDTRVTGEFEAITSAGELTGTFNAPVCASN